MRPNLPGRLDDQPLARIKRYACLAAAFWTAVMLVAWAWALHQQRLGNLNVAMYEARSRVGLEIAFSEWMLGQEGVYVPMTRNIPPEAFLHVPEKDIKTPSGRRLTMISHASAMKQLFQMQAMNAYSGHSCHQSRTIPSQRLGQYPATVPVVTPPVSERSDAELLVR